MEQKAVEKELAEILLLAVLAQTLADECDIDLLTDTDENSLTEKLLACMEELGSDDVEGYIANALTQMVTVLKNKVLGSVDIEEVLGGFLNV